MTRPFMKPAVLHVFGQRGLHTRRIKGMQWQLQPQSAIPSIWPEFQPRQGLDYAAWHVLTPVGVCAVLAVQFYGGWTAFYARWLS